MTWTEYVAAARRTQNKDLTPEQRLAHSVFGMMSEWEELMENRHSIYGDDLVLELGDYCWFVVEFMDSIGYEITDEQFREYAYAAALHEDQPENKVGKTLAQISGQVQKTYQGHELDRRFMEEVARKMLGYACAYYYHTLGLEPTLEDAFAKNVRKLLVRYPSAKGFTTEDSIRRVDTE